MRPTVKAGSGPSCVSGTWVRGSWVSAGAFCSERGGVGARIACTGPGGEPWKVPSRLPGPFRHQYSNSFTSHRRVKLDPTVFLLSKINVGRFLVQPEPHCLEFPLEDGTVVVDLLLASVQDHENEVRGAGHGNHFLPTPFPVRCAFDDS